MAFFHAEGGTDACIHEGMEKALLSGKGRASVGEAFDGIIGDEVDGAPDTAQEAGEGIGLFLGTGDTIEEDVFEGDHPSGIGLVFAAGPHELGDRVALIDRHDPISDLVGGCVEGDGEAHLARVADELEDTGDEAAGGDGDLAGSDAGAFGVVQNRNAFQDVVEVGERLTHSHVDDIGDPFLLNALEHLNLTGDLAGGEVADQSLESARAEAACEGAADLGGYACGEAAGCGDQDAFDQVAVGKAEEEFAGIVSGLGGLDEGEWGDRQFFCEQDAQFLGEIGHLIIGTGELIPDPFAELFSAELGEFGGQHFRFQGGGEHAAYRGGDIGLFRHFECDWGGGGYGLPGWSGEPAPAGRLFGVFFGALGF